MKAVSFDYGMRITFSEEVSEHRFTLRCLPREGVRQHVTELEYRIEPASFIRNTEDAFGNRCLFGCKHGLHKDFFVNVQGRANCDGSIGEPAGPEHRLGLYRAQTQLTRLEEAQLDIDFGDTYRKSIPAFIEKVQIAIHERMTYVKGATGAMTTAGEAFDIGSGVCQDYVHIFLSFLRRYGIACRYVAGIVPGGGETHAWADVCIDGAWYGFDPTNCRRIDDEYLALSCGRDAADCAINRGIFFGNAMQRMVVTSNLVEGKEVSYG